MLDVARVCEANTFIDLSNAFYDYIQHKQYDREYKLFIRQRLVDHCAV